MTWAPVVAVIPAIHMGAGDDLDLGVTVDDMGKVPDLPVERYGRGGLPADRNRSRPPRRLIVNPVELCAERRRTGDRQQLESLKLPEKPPKIGEFAN